MSRRIVIGLGGFFLPAVEAVTQTFGLLAIRGAGKSNLAAVMAEGMHDAGQPFVVVDPTGTWWGLRSSADGKGAGIPIPIFGGAHGDVPLERGGGHVVADLIAEQRLSCVVDVSEFSEGDKTRFLADFAERLYRKNKEPLHLFLEEADDFIPQKPMREQARTLGAFENIVRRGRARGLGITMITQRSAVINKNVLTQIETLFVLRTTSPQDRKAIQAWVDYHGVNKDIVESLPTLATGEAWVWSPSWLKDKLRIKVRRRRTFDSASTPKAGSRRVTTLANVDLQAVRERMADTIERAKADDPRELKRQIAEFRKVLEREKAERARLSEQIVRVGEIAKAKVAVVPDVSKRMHSLMSNINHAQAMLVQAERDHQEIQRTLDAVKTTMSKGKVTHFKDVTFFESGGPIAAPAAKKERFAASSEKVIASAALYAGSNGKIGKCERAILTALAMYPDGRNQNQVALLSGYRQSGGFRNSLSSLRSNGLIEGGGDRMKITEAGQNMLVAFGAWERLPTGDALVEWWKGRLGKCERAILEVVANSMHGSSLTQAEIANASGYQESGGFRNSMSKLRTLGLIEGRGDAIRLGREISS